MRPETKEKEVQEYPLASASIDKFDKINEEVNKLFGSNREFGLLLEHRPDLAFKLVSTYLIAFVTIPTEVLRIYAALLTKELIVVVKRNLINRRQNTL